MTAITPEALWLKKKNILFFQKIIWYLDIISIIRFLNNELNESKNNRTNKNCQNATLRNVLICASVSIKYLKLYVFCFLSLSIIEFRKNNRKVCCYTRYNGAFCLEFLNILWPNSTSAELRKIYSARLLFELKT